MRIAWLFVIGALCAFAAPRAAAGESFQPTGDLHITGTNASAWRQADRHIIQVEGPVQIQTEQARMTAQQAVIWLSPLDSGALDQRIAEIALVGDATLTQPGGIVRSGPRLAVDMIVQGKVRFEGGRLVPEDRSDSELYVSALALRRMERLTETERDAAVRWLQRQPRQWTAPTTGPAPRPAWMIPPANALSYRADSIHTITTDEGRVAIVLDGNITVIQTRQAGAIIELMAQHGVLFTTLKDMRELEESGRFKRIEDAVTAAYLEGDVRINQTPAGVATVEQRLEANRAYYDLQTDRAVLTDVVIHTAEPKSQTPIVVRAQKVRQLSMGEYEADKGVLTTSLFATPSYSIRSTSVYVRQTPAEGALGGARTVFQSRNTTLNLGPVPLFYLPATAGSVTDKGPLRGIQLDQSSGFGLGIQTEWGLYETLGQLPPRDLDVSYRLDYYTDRGPAVGIDGSYAGGFVTQTTRQPWTFTGGLTAYGVYDTGKDDLGERRLEVTPPDESRGRIWWQHLHFLPGDWRMQMSAGYISDPTFQEEWFRDDYATKPPRQTSLFISHATGSEALTFRASVQTSDFVTSSDLVQEQVEVQRLLEVGYYRLGDSVLGDSSTFFSANTLSALKFRTSDATLEEQGYPLVGGRRLSPGLPSLGYTGTPDDVVYRGDFRQEVDFPFSIEPFRIVPYLMARYTPYSDSPDGSNADRGLGGAGLRVATSFWKVDDNAQSDLLDIHRLRHVVEPQLNVFASAATTDSDNVLVYDEGVDTVDDLGVVQLALRQRWQTKRGGPGRWRNVDVFSLNVEGNWFFQRPDEDRRRPDQFRGLFFDTLPEASIPRNSVNADATWQISDTTALTGDAQYNTDEGTLATAAARIAVRRDPRVAYSLGLRYIQMDLDETVGENRFIFEDQLLLIFSMNYQLTSKYSMAVSQRYDLAQDRSNRSVVRLIRQFDRLFVAVALSVDNVTGESGFGINVWPEGVVPSQTASRIGASLFGD